MRLTAALVSMAILILPAPRAAQAQRATNAGVNLYSPAKEIELGRASRAELEKSLAIVREPVVNAYLKRLGGELAKHAKGNFFPYSFTLFDDRRAAVLSRAGIPPFPVQAEEGDLAEALAVAGGPVFVPLRLMSAIESEAELAAMLAHAIAHIALRHPTRMETRRRMNELTASARPQHPVAEELGRAGLAYFARKLELDADELAVRILADAGYDPVGLVGFLRAAPRRPRSSDPQTLVAHPSPEARIKVLEGIIRALPRRGDRASAGQWETIKPLISRLP